MFRSISNLLLKHERLLIALLVIGFVWANYQTAINYLDHRAQSRAVQAHAQLQQQQASDALLADAVTQAQRRYEQLAARFAEQNKTLQAAQAQRDAQTVTQQVADSKLPPDQLAQRWTGLIQQEGVIPTQAGYEVSAVAAVQTVEALDVIPGLYKDLQDEQQVAGNTQSELAASQNVNAALADQLTGVKTEITKQDQACKADIASLKAQQRKSKLRWFGVGFFVGAIARNLVGL